MLQGRAQPVCIRKPFEDHYQALAAVLPKWSWLFTCPGHWTATGNQSCYLSSCFPLWSDSNHSPTECVHTSGLSILSLQWQSYLLYIFKSCRSFISNLMEALLQQFRVCTQTHSLLKIYSCLNKLLFQPYYKTRPKTYAQKNVPCVILPQVTIWSLPFEAEQKYICHKLYSESLEWAVSIAQDSSAPTLQLAPTWVKEHKKKPLDCSFYFQSNCSDPLI